MFPCLFPFGFSSLSWRERLAVRPSPAAMPGGSLPAPTIL